MTWEEQTFVAESSDSGTAMLTVTNLIITLSTIYASSVFKQAIPRFIESFVTQAETMLITKTHYDVPSKLDNGRPIRIYVISPSVPNYPQAKFPGRINFAQLRPYFDSHSLTSKPGVVIFR
jgi:hypothetical protein